MNAKHLLAASMALVLIGCGNEDSDKPEAPKPPPVPVFNPTIEGYSNASGIDLEQLAGLNGQELIDGMTEQLNKNITAKTSSEFKITPQWGFGVNSWDVVNLEVVQDVDGAYALQTILPPDSYTKPSSDNAINNGFRFMIDLPNGQVKEAAIKYKFKLNHEIGTSPDRTPDYFFMGGFTSGDVEPSTNSALPAGSGFTYKFSTDRYGYFNTRFGDVTDFKFANQQIKVNGTPPRLAPDQWHSVQLNLSINDISAQNGSADMFYNGEEALAAPGQVVNRTLVDAQHQYKLQAVMETYRHSNFGANGNLKEQIVYITDLVIGWNDESITVPVN